MMPIDDPYSRLDAELAYARKRCSELSDEVASHIDSGRDIRRRFGALDGETLFAFVARIVRERATLGVELATERKRAVSLGERVEQLESELVCARTVEQGRHRRFVPAGTCPCCGGDLPCADCRPVEPAARSDSAALRDAEEKAATARKAANALAEQNAEMRALLIEALRRHDETPLGEWARAARALVQP